MKRHSNLYTLLFALAVCVVCGTAVAGTVAMFQERQRENSRVERIRHILVAAGLAQPGEELDREQVLQRSELLRPLAVDLQTGEIDPRVDALNFDQRDAAADPALSRPAPNNDAGVHRLPPRAIVYETLSDDGKPGKLVFPIHGLGHNGPIFGLIALDAADLNTVRGLGFYEHQETPGVAELDSPSWLASWDGRRIFDDQGSVALELIPNAGPADSNPHRVDAFTGATVTSHAVRNMLRFWFGESGFGPFLEKYGASR